MHTVTADTFDAFVASCIDRCLVDNVALTGRLFDFGGCRLAVQFLGQTEPAFFTDAIAHREQPNGALPPDLTVYVADGHATGMTLPRPPWNWHQVDEHGTVTAIDPAHGYVNYQSDYETLLLLDYARSRALVWVADARQLPEWERSFPFRMLLHKWLESSRFVLVHAGAVGLPTGGFLLAGRGGSGKSTSTLACLDSALSYAGDDFVLVDTERQYVHSLYNVAKLNADNLHRFPRWEPLIANRTALPEQKGQLFIQQHSPAQVASGFPVRAILLPRFTGGRDTDIRAATGADALRALAPSTLALLRAGAVGGASPTFRKMVRLVHSLPCFWLNTGTDLPQIPDCLLTLLHKINQSNDDQPTAAVHHPAGF